MSQDPAARRDAVSLRRGASPETMERVIVRETLLVIRILDGEQFSLMHTPGEEKELALGFLLAEGWIESRQDLASIEVCAGGDSVKVRLAHPPDRSSSPARSLVLHPSCGLCGREDTVPYLAALEPIPAAPPFPLAALWGLSDRLRERQHLFAETGGCHATGIFDRAGRIGEVAEDIGRHAAFDKMIGKAMLRGHPTAGLGAVLSGRSSLEMVAKAARARLALLVAVGAPSEAAISLAGRLGMGLAGFARGDELTVYAGQGRFEI